MAIRGPCGSHCHCGAPCHLKVRVNGCISTRGLKGALVQVKSGATVVASATTATGGTATTDGLVTFTTVPLGTYTLVVSKSRFVTSTQTITFACGAGNADMQVTVTLTPATGYTCCAAINDPIPTTLHLTSGTGAHTLPFGVDGGGIGYNGVSSAQWQQHGTYATTGYKFGLDPVTGTSCKNNNTSGPINTEDTYWIWCNGLGTIMLTQGYRITCCGTGIAGYNDVTAGGGNNHNDFSLAVDPDNSVPLNLSFAVNANFTFSAPSACAGVSFANIAGTPVTVTE